MRNTRRRSTTAALFMVLVLVTAACGNSKGSTGAPTTAAPDSGGTVSTVAGGKQVPVDAPGVTATTIKVGGVASVTNPLGGPYGDAFNGVQAYFDMINSEGGIYGRKLVLGAKEDDQLANNSSEVTKLLTQEKVFAVLPVATLLFTGAAQLVQQGVPTFGWNINTEWSGSAKAPNLNLFGETGSYIGFTAADPTVPWLAKQAHAHKVGVLAYSVPQSAECTQGLQNSFKKYGARAGAKIVFDDASLPYGVADLSVDVAKMKKAGVDLVTTCMDTNGVVTLGKEMKKQQLNAPQYMPDSYDHNFIEKFSDLFQGSYVRTDFVQWEDPSKPKGLQEFLTWIAKQDVKPNENSMTGWLNADLFVQGLKAAGPDFSRQKLIDAINKMTDYTADGAVYKVDWTTGHTQNAPEEDHCQFVSQIKGATFSPVFSRPGKPFVCPVVTPTSLGTRFTA